MGEIGQGRSVTLVQGPSSLIFRQRFLKRLKTPNLVCMLEVTICIVGLLPRLLLCSVGIVRFSNSSSSNGL